MRVPIALLLAMLAAVRSTAQQESPPTTGEPAPAPPAVEQTTEVQGPVPDLTGRWLVVFHLGMAADQPAVTVPRFWDVTSSGGAPKFDDRSVKLPPAMQERLKSAGTTWNPTPDDLKELAAAWDTLPPEDRALSSVKVEVFAKGHLDEVLQNEASTKDAEWSVRETYLFQPGTGRPVRETSVFGAREATPSGWRGDAALIMLAMAPFPVPISLRGTAEMYRLAEPSRGLLARIADVFSGCGRRK